MSTIGFVVSAVLFLLSVTGIYPLALITILLPLLVAVGIDVVLFLIWVIFGLSVAAIFGRK